MGVCDRCGQSGDTTPLFHRKYHLCKECVMDWFPYFESKQQKKHVFTEKEGEERFKQFLKEKKIWSVS